MSRFNRQRRVEILSSPSGFGWQQSMMSYGAALICINRPFGFIGPRQYPFLTVCAIERLAARPLAIKTRQRRALHSP
jgi:hypothetical protein